MTQESDHKVPGEGYSEKIHARFWIKGQETYIGIGRVTLLEKIADKGSINAAAKEMGMSYKKAWKLIDEMNRFFSEPLVVKEHGGKSGGGTQLTDKGVFLVEEFRRIERRLTEFLEQESNRLEI
ncbi:MAG: winged helix-turn-helix domain-containing protein [Hydrogenovibrio sp.]|nr:winged helix-turn-helix domain-containing protein [Hydrogenovibrio sp.]